MYNFVYLTWWKFTSNSFYLALVWTLNIIKLSWKDNWSRLFGPICCLFQCKFDCSFILWPDKMSSWYKHWVMPYFLHLFLVGGCRYSTPFAILDNIQASNSAGKPESFYHQNQSTRRLETNSLSSGTGKFYTFSLHKELPSISDCLEVMQYML